MKDKTIHFDALIFSAYIQPNGWLDWEPESHALWYYYTRARATYERIILDPIVLVGDKDPEANFRQLFTSVATIYGVKPEAMAKCWPMIDMQCDTIGCPRLPDEERYRFNREIVIETGNKH